MGRHVARMGESRNAYRVLVVRPEGKRPLGRPRRRWEDNIKMDLREVVCNDRDWINLAQDRDRWRAYVRAAMNLRVICRVADKGRENVDTSNIRPVLPVVTYRSVPSVKLSLKFITQTYDVSTNDNYVISKCQGSATKKKMPRMNDKMKKLIDTPRPHIIRHEEYHNSKSHRLCALDVGLWHFVSPRELCGYKGKVETVSGGVPGSSVGRALHYLQIRTISSQFTVLLAQSLEFTVSRTTDLQTQFTVLELRSLQLRSTALELRPSDADTVADAHSSGTPVHKAG
ncbi:hypothetical protein ANN_26814 [Periplaneta americana]|uniref:Uncharacterized protein n=1 Tax=Periplaneta americana TaxID=6978 RepID=A0ABQ8RZB7_PERAM|nr:hypothetical protein ANN_26814 [Periplaneta americana]